MLIPLVPMVTKEVSIHYYNYITYWSIRLIFHQSHFWSFKATPLYYVPMSLEHEINRYTSG